MTRIFLARLADLPVLDPYGDQLGRIRDVVLRMRLENQAPRITGLVVEIQHRRRIFVPIGRITAFEPDTVMLGTGTVNVRQFKQHPGELLAFAELLDRKVTIIESGTIAMLVDVAMDQNRAHEWLITKLAVREQTGRLTRRGQLHQLDWHEVQGVITVPEEQGAAHMLAAFEQLHPADLANMLQDLSFKRRAEVAAALDDERLADVLEELPENDQVEIIESLQAERAADVLEAMDPDDAADLLGELPEGEKEELLRLMRPEDAADMRRLLHYSANTAGGLMTTNPVIVSPDATIAQALAKIRAPEISPVVAAQVYVCRSPIDTPTGRYLGVVHFQRLLREPPSSLVSSALDTDLDPIDPQTPLPEVTRSLATYDLMAIPVVDSADRLLGAVTVDDVLDHILPTDWRDRANE
ncbi:MAG: magnesium transporter [Corynebacteriales bacterium]|nr:magnesium transporter [Mycobacteriales bacterium]